MMTDYESWRKRKSLQAAFEERPEMLEALVRSHNLENASMDLLAAALATFGITPEQVQAGLAKAEQGEAPSAPTPSQQ